MAKCKAKEYLNSKMEQSMMANIKIVGNMGSASTQRMVKYSKASGRMVSGKGRVTLRVKMEWQRRGTGKEDKDIILEIK